MEKTSFILEKIPGAIVECDFESIQRITRERYGEDAVARAIDRDYSWQIYRKKVFSECSSTLQGTT